MDDLLQRIAGQATNTAADDGSIGRALEAIADVNDDIARRRVGLCLLESRIDRLRRQNAALDARWLASARSRGPISAGETAGLIEHPAAVRIGQFTDTANPPVPRPDVASKESRAADDRAGRPPRRGIRAVFARARTNPSAAQDLPPPRTKS